MGSLVADPLGKVVLTRMIDNGLFTPIARPDRVPRPVFEAAAETGFYISREKVLMEGRLELLRYFREQSISKSYHRCGNLGERTAE